MESGNDQITKILMLLLTIFLIILFILVAFYVVLLIKKNKEKKEINKKENTSDIDKKKDIELYENKKQSIFNFMEFDKIEDNMIIQKEKVKYIMVVECQGVNYDLMSGIEKNAVEEGFLQFLNTLRHPIQLYVQTRTIDLGSSINMYKERVLKIEAELNRKQQQYEDMLSSGRYTEQQRKKMIFEITKQRNLYEYGKDVITNTERMSLNKNILSKKYYVIIPYYPSELGTNEFDEQEIKNMAFSELYTRSQAIIRTLSACSVKGKILNTRELIELLYVAYNRDQSEDYGIDKALLAQYDKLYSTSEDVYDKKIGELNKIIEEKAVEKAVSKVETIRSKKEQNAIKQQRKMNELIDEMAKMIIEENKEYIGNDIAEEAIKSLGNEIKESDNKKEVEIDAKEKTRKKTTRTRRQTN